MNPPEIRSLAAGLASLPSADVWTWSRGTHPREGNLSIFHDDIPNDLRTIHEIRFTRYSIRITHKTLCKYDPVKHCWNEYGRHRPELELANRAGEKRLRDFIRAAALAERGYPNPEIFTVYPQQVKP